MDVESSEGWVIVNAKVRRSFKKQVEERLAKNECVRCKTVGIRSLGLCVKCYSQFAQARYRLRTQRQRVEFMAKLIEQGMLVAPHTHRKHSTVFDRVAANVSKVG
jgi:ribosomal protein L37AE/L43A